LKFGKASVSLGHCGVRAAPADSRRIRELCPTHTR